MTRRLARWHGEHPDWLERAEQQQAIVSAHRRADRVVIVDQLPDPIALQLRHDVAMHDKARL